MRRLVDHRRPGGCGPAAPTGIATRSIAGASPSSDQQRFIDHGIPGVQLFAGAHLDYHRPSDTADKIDVAGLVKFATVARAAIDSLVQRPAPLTATTFTGCKGRIRRR
ncbi:MAG: M28 family peptidase [Sinobacteraceae bacterium]|nr:M28 family peptidase [Nevskiaceae bacterium]MCP5470692.1 M28 family peptidase [Nevskiaceae bacterium]